MDKELKIRRAKASDALLLMSISFGAKRCHNESEDLKSWQDKLVIAQQYIEENTVFVVNKNETIIAYCSIRQDKETGCWLDQLFVRPAYVRKGIGSSLIEEVIKFCREHQIEAINVLSDSNGKVFYEKLGAEYIREMDADSSERSMSLYSLSIENSGKSSQLTAGASNKVFFKKKIRPDQSLIKQKLDELDKEIDEEAEDGEEDISIEDFKFTEPIGYKFQCEEIKRANEEASAAEEITSAELIIDYEGQEINLVKRKQLKNKAVIPAELDKGNTQGELVTQKVKQIIDKAAKEEKNQREKTSESTKEKKEMKERETEKREVSEIGNEINFKSEKQKMLEGKEYIAWGDEMSEDRKNARRLIRAFNLADPEDEKQKKIILKELLGKSGEYIHIEPDFKCEYGYNILVGDNLYIGYNCVILDQAKVTIGDNCIISPQVGIYTLAYPVNMERRLAGYEYARPVTIGNNVWIGAGSIIKPGTTIGEGSVIEPGSVVDSDIRDHVIAGGNPAKVIKEIDE